jgi:hypothetical protein
MGCRNVCRICEPSSAVRRYSSFRQRLVHFRRRARLRGTRRLNNRHSSSIAAAKAIFSREVVGARIRASGLGHGQGSAAVTFHRSSKETPRVSGTHPGRIIRGLGGGNYVFRDAPGVVRHDGFPLIAQVSGRRRR